MDTLDFESRARLLVQARRAAGLLDPRKSEAELTAEVRGELLAAAEARGRARAPARAPAPKAAAAPLVLAAPAAATKPPRAAQGGANAALYAMARDEARQVIKRYAARDLYPPQADIADEVAATLRQRGIFGADGKPLTGATLKRHAFKGISSAAKQALSTIPQRGK